MQRYPVRPSHRGNLQLVRLAELARGQFEAVEEREGAVQARYGAISRISIRPEGKELSVDLTMDPKVAADVAAATIQRYNRFLEEATGYSSTERAKRLKKAAGA